MQTRDVLLALVLGFAGFIFIIIPALFLLLSLVPPAPCVGLITVNGVLTTDSSAGAFSGGIMSSENFAEIVEEAQARDEIKAVVFEVNSPGGSVVASGEMYRTVQGLDKPKIIFFREVAASGGYYLAMGGDEIISDPNAITGSIGARATFIDLSGLLSDLGIEMTNIKSGDLKDMGDINRPLTEEEYEIVQAIVDDSFNEFKQIVIEARKDRANFTLAKFETVTDGRLLSGRQALALGLVDELGGKKDAIRRAAVLGGLEGEDFGICELSREPGFWDLLFSSSANALAEIFAHAFELSAPTGGLNVELR